MEKGIIVDGEKGPALPSGDVRAELVGLIKRMSRIEAEQDRLKRELYCLRTVNQDQK